jgi:hypothetical protein
LKNKILKKNESVKTGAQASLLTLSVCFLDAKKPSIMFNLNESERRYTAEKRGVASRDACAPV